MYMGMMKPEQRSWLYVEHGPERTVGEIAFPKFPEVGTKEILSESREHEQLHFQDLLR